MFLLKESLHREEKSLGREFREEVFKSLHSNTGQPGG